MTVIILQVTFYLSGLRKCSRFISFVVKRGSLLYALYIKVALIDIFAITVYQMWKGPLVVKNLQRIITWICSSPQFTELYSFIVSFSSLFSCPAATLLFWLTLTALIASFAVKNCKKPLHTTCSATNRRQTQLETSWRTWSGAFHS